MTKLDIRKLIKWVFKLAGVLVTSPATYMAASQFARHYRSTSLTVGAFTFDPVQVLVEGAAVVLVEGIFLYAWLNLDLNKGNVGERAGDVAFSWAMFAVIFSIAVTQGEVEAVIIRAPIAIMLARETWDNIIAVISYFMPEEREHDKKSGKDREPMLVRFNNWWKDVREEILHRNEQWRAFKALRRQREQMHRDRIIGEIENTRRKNELRNLRTLELIERDRVAGEIGLADETGEVYMTTSEALTYLKKNGVSYSGAWLRGKAREGIVGSKVGGEWKFTKTELDTLI